MPLDNLRVCARWYFGNWPNLAVMHRSITSLFCAPRVQKEKWCNKFKVKGNLNLKK